MPHLETTLTEAYITFYDLEYPFISKSFVPNCESNAYWSTLQVCMHTYFIFPSSGWSLSSGISSALMSLYTSNSLSYNVSLLRFPGHEMYALTYVTMTMVNIHVNNNQILRSFVTWSIYIARCILSFYAKS